MQLQIDKAAMAIMGGRYKEAEEIYLNLIENNYTENGWIGLGITKLYQIDNGVALNEVKYSFDKAKSLSNNIDDIDKQIILYATSVLISYFNFYKEKIESLQSEKIKTALGVGLATLSAFSGANSKKGYGQIMGVIGTTAGVGVALDSISAISNNKEMQKYLHFKIEEISSFVKYNVNNYLIEYEEFVNLYTTSFTDILQLKENIKTSEKNTVFLILLYTPFTGILMLHRAYLKLPYKKRWIFGLGIFKWAFHDMFNPKKIVQNSNN
jgi:hypothetical protein